MTAVPHPTLPGWSIDDEAEIVSPPRPDFVTPLAYSVILPTGERFTTYQRVEPGSHWCGSRVGTTNSRFGDICCGGCALPLAWSPQLVREGIYGDDTDAWIAGQELLHQRVEDGHVDVWGRRIMQPHDGHSAWACNNYRCTRHPAALYGRTGW